MAAPDVGERPDWSARRYRAISIETVAIGYRLRFGVGHVIGL